MPKMPRTLSTACWAFLCALALAVVTPAMAKSDKDGHLAWTKDYSLILTSATREEQADEIVDFINSHGGQVAIVVSPRMMLGWAPKSLVGQNGIRSIHQKAVSRDAVKPGNVDEADSLGFFNEVVSGEWATKKAAVADHVGEAFRLQDGFERPGTTQLPAPQNGAIVNISTEAAASPGNSDQMAGRARFNAVFVESAGPLCIFGICIGDTNTYSWTCADLSTIVSELSASLSFWSSRASTYGVPLTYSTSYFRPAVTSGLSTCSGTSKVLTNYEPILHAQSDDGLWISQIMCNMGYCAGNKFDRTTAFNTARRSVSTASNWSVTSFIGYNPSPAPTTFTDGYFAYAYRGGPYSQLLFRNDGWAVSQYDLVNSHETGHLFGTYDEYASSSCSNCDSGDATGNNIPNGNCLNCNAGSVPCMMRSNESALCGYTPGQIGWGIDITGVKTVGTSSFTEKTNWIPGQPIRYYATLNVPSLKTGSCLDVGLRVYRQFPNGLTEADGPFDLPCFINSPGTWFFYEFNVAVPNAAEPGEATVEMQFDIKVNGSACPIGECRYAKGVRASQRSHVFVLGSGANPTSVAATISDPQIVGGKLE